MQAHQLKPPKGAKHARKRIGRGNASGHGTYATKGLKGQKARAGRKPRRFFEGGQTELMRRLPHSRGFTNPFRTEFTAVNLRDLERFEDGAEITLETLLEAGVVSGARSLVKVLGTGELTKKLTVSVHRVSVSAQEKIEAAGGSVTVLMPVVKKVRKVKAKKKAAAAPKAETEEAAAEAPAETSDEPAKDQESDGSGE